MSETVWGVAESGARHAFRLTCGACVSPEQHRRTHKPHSVCGVAWASDWPVVEIRRNRTCQRCAILAPEKGTRA